MSSHGLVGPMGSKKTETLLKIIKENEMAGKSVCKIKYSGDTRFTSDSVIISHNKNKTDAKLYSSFENLHASDFTNYEMIFIDEIQFIKDAVRFVKDCVTHGIHVVWTALYTNYKLETWPITVELLKFSTVDILMGVCTVCDKHEACYTKCLHPEEMGKSNIKIAGFELFSPRCIQCFDLE